MELIFPTLGIVVLRILIKPQQESRLIKRLVQTIPQRGPIWFLLKVIFRVRESLQCYLNKLGKWNLIRMLSGNPGKLCPLEIVKPWIDLRESTTVDIWNKKTSETRVNQWLKFQITRAQPKCLTLNN